jgi:hypothetical protein
MTWVVNMVEVDVMVMVVVVVVVMVVNIAGEESNGKR